MAYSDTMRVYPQISENLWFNINQEGEIGKCRIFIIFAFGKLRKPSFQVSEARESGNLMECVCCCDEECLVEDMLPCGGGHLFCKDCVQRASEVAIGN